MSVPFRLVPGFEKHLPAARVRRGTSSSPLRLVLSLTSSSALPRHQPSIAAFDHHSKAVDHPRDRKPPHPRGSWPRDGGRHPGIGAALRAATILRPVSEDNRRTANFRVHLVPAVLALANPPWQRDVWLDPSAFEDLDHIFHTLFDDFCDADNPEGHLGISLRTREEVALMRQLGTALNAATADAPHDTDEEHLASRAWPEVVAVAGRLAQVMVANDLNELVALHESEPATDDVPPHMSEPAPLSAPPSSTGCRSPSRWCWWRRT